MILAVKIFLFFSLVLLFFIIKNIYVSILRIFKKKEFLEFKNFEEEFEAQQNVSSLCNELNIKLDSEINLNK